MPTISIQRLLFLVVYLFALAALTGCGKSLEFSERRDTAQRFMDALASNDTATATNLAIKTPEHAMAVRLMADAIALRIQNEGIREFRYVYVSDTSTETNKARAVFSQLVDGKSTAENIVVEMEYLPQESRWLIHNVILR
ncbi:MAG TPA: hypothetical protein VFV39_07985 [Limnobacter sp.]|nr:hypothetical protein [Limnobacter sp.]